MHGLKQRAMIWKPVFAQIDLKNCTIRIADGAGHYIDVKIGEGNVTYSEHRTTKAARLVFRGGPFAARNLAVPLMTELSLFVMLCTMASPAGRFTSGRRSWQR